MGTKVKFRRKGILAMILAVTFLLTALPAVAGFEGDIPTVSHDGLNAVEKAFVERLDYDNVETYLRYLSETIGSRFSGTPEEDETVEYLTGQLESFGYQPWVEEFEMLRYPAGSAPTPNYFNNGLLTIGEDTYNVYGPAWAANSKYQFYGEISAPAVVVDLPNADTSLLPDISDIDVSGKIAIIPLSASGSIISNQYTTIYTDAIGKLSEAGAAGIVFVYLKPADDGNTGYSRIAAAAISNQPADINIPVGCVKYNDADKFISLLDSDTEITLSMELDKYAKNVFAYLPSAVGSKKTVYISCHHDSVISGPGCNDNASGTAMTLEMARAFKDVPFEYNIMFMFFGSEENGLLGAYNYCNNMSDEEKSNFVANFNMDMISTGADDCNYIFVNISDTRLQTLQSAIKDNNVALKDNPAAVAIAEENIAYNASVKAAEKLDFPMENYFFCYDTTTDHYAFVVEGRKNDNAFANMFNAIEYDWRSNRRGTGFELLYHRVGDTPELNYSKTRMQSQGDIISLAIFDTAGVYRIPATGIRLTAKPAKLEYQLGEQLDLTGLVVTGVYADGLEREVTEYTTDPAVGTLLNTAGPVTVTVSFGEFTASLEITVSRAEAAPVWASGVTSGAKTKGVNDSAPDLRVNTGNALGGQNAYDFNNPLVPINNAGITALRYYENVTYSFGAPIVNRPNDYDLTLYEITQGAWHPEAAEIWLIDAVVDGQTVDKLYIGTVFNAPGNLLSKLGMISDNGIDGFSQELVQHGNSSEINVWFPENVSGAGAVMLADATHKYNIYNEANAGLLLSSFNIKDNGNIEYTFNGANSFRSGDAWYKYSTFLARLDGFDLDAIQAFS